MAHPDLAGILPDTCRLERDDICLGTHSLRRLAEDYGTPLYVYDAETLRAAARRITDVFAPLGARFSYAAKACSLRAVLRVLGGCGLGLDVVSLGELTAGLRAGFEPQNIHVHGNVKTDLELETAVRAGVHAVVADSAREVERLARICERIDTEVRVMLRLQLALEAETHGHLNTSGPGSKFGIPRSSSEERRAISALLTGPRLRFLGLHTHLGSQIADPDVYRRAAEEMAAAVTDFRDQGLTATELSLGGGWAVPYRWGEPALPAAAVMDAVSGVLTSLPGVRPAFEPGRSLVARAAVALYGVGSVKSSPTGRIVAVDGGMGDNPRPALYGARYTALSATRPLAPVVGLADVVGRYCESGDVLAREVPLPGVDEGDLICIPVAGAYQLAMASAYNLVAPPAAVLIDADGDTLVSRRATVEDLLARDL